MLDKVQEGWVIVLTKGLHVHKYATKTTEALTEDTIVVVENARTAQPGSEDDHFEETYMADVRPLKVDADGTLHYDHQAPVWMICQYGDLDAKYIQEEFAVLHKWRRSYAPWN